MTKQTGLLNKTRVIGIIFLFILMSIIPSVAVDTVNIEHANGKSSGDDVDWWPMFRHDLQHSGYSTSKAPDTNNVLWTYTTDDNVFTSLAVVDGRVYIASDYIFFGEDVYCLDANTGDHIWSHWIGGDQSSSPAVADGKVYIGSIGYLYCLDAFTGKYIWRYGVDHYEFSSPAVADGKVYIGTWSHPYTYDGNLYCLDADTGDYIWSYKIGDEVHSSPAIADGKVYFGSDDGCLYCLNATYGDYIWINYIGNHYSCGVGSSPAVANGKIYIGSFDHNVYCLDANTGDYIWSYTTDHNVYSSPAVADGKIYIGSDDDKVYCLDANTGDYIWSYTTKSRVRSSPAVADGKVYIGSETGVVYAFGILDSDAPSTPEISGPKIGASGILYNFTFKSESPVGNDLYYWIEWSDGSNSGWLGPYGSGVEITESHVWDARGRYLIQAKAKDTNGSVSSWGIYKLRILRTRATVNSLFLRFLEQFPILSRLLYLIK